MFSVPCEKHVFFESLTQVLGRLKPGYWIEDCVPEGDALKFVAVSNSYSEGVYLYTVKEINGNYQTEWRLA